MTQRRRRRQIDETVQRRIEALAITGAFNAKEIHETITDELGIAIPGTNKKTPPCSIRTVQNIARGKFAPDDSPPWSFDGAEPSEAALVMPVLRALIERTEAKRIHITVNEAAEVVKVRRVNPLLSPWDAWRYAREYVVLRLHGQPKTELDATVAVYDPHDPGPMTALRKVLVTTTRSTTIRDFLEGPSAEPNPVGIHTVDISKNEEDDHGKAPK